MQLFDAPKVDIKSNLLVDRFIVPPFSVLDTMQGYWLNRKRHWVGLGIKSELGRKDDLIDFSAMGSYSEMAKIGVSIFDPVLCELMYTWFSREGDEIFDPFAGGSVRGIVAGSLQRKYTGIDLRQEQVDANKVNYNEISNKFSNIIEPTWICGDSLNCKTLVPQEKQDKKFNMLMTCPPYYDLEQYSDKPEDLSNLSSYDEFIDIYGKIFKESYDMIENDSFAVVVVSEIRDKNGVYRNFVADTIKVMQEAGYKYYNEIILMTSVGSLMLRAPKQFNAGRKIGRRHQNVLVFYRGDPKNIGDKFGEVELA